jgi:hypothetical protein
MMGEDLLASVLGGVYTHVEKTLIELERGQFVRDNRSMFQDTMQTAIHRHRPAALGPERGALPQHRSRPRDRALLPRGAVTATAEGPRKRAFSPEVELAATP